MDLAEWRRRRAKLNHDWLLRDLLATLEAALKRADEGGGYRIDSADIARWVERKSEMKSLIDSAVGALSPRSFVRLAPLKSLDAPTREGLGEAIHGAFLQASKIEDRLVELRALYKSANEAMLKLRTQPETIVAARDSVLALSRAISALPNWIQLP